jgi:tetratricopeptide (TPR) repeat protein
VAGQAALFILKAGVTAFAGAALLLAVLGLWLDRRVEPWEAAVLGGVVLAAMALAITSTSAAVVFGVIFLFAAVPICLQQLGRLAERQASERLLGQDETRARQLIAADPRNAAAYSLLGDVYRQRGELDRAVKHYAHALEVSPGSTEDRYKLEKASKELSLQERGAQLCPMCREEIDRSQRRCPHCNYTLSLGEGLREWTQARGPRKAVTASLLIAVPLTVLLVFLVPFLHRPFGTVIVLMAAALIVIVVVLLRLGLLERREL